MSDSLWIRVLDGVQLFVVIACIGIGAGTLLHLGGEFVILTYLLPENMK